MIIARNYLEVYPYEKWNAKEIHVYESGQTFEPTSIEMADGETAPPNLLTEADLIALMEKHGIGTVCSLYVLLIDLTCIAECSQYGHHLFRRAEREETEAEGKSSVRMGICYKQIKVCREQ